MGNNAWFWRKCRIHLKFWETHSKLKNCHIKVKWNLFLKILKSTLRGGCLKLHGEVSPPGTCLKILARRGMPLSYKEYWWKCPQLLNESHNIGGGYSQKLKIIDGSYLNSPLKTRTCLHNTSDVTYHDKTSYYSTNLAIKGNSVIN